MDTQQSRQDRSVAVLVFIALFLIAIFSALDSAYPDESPLANAFQATALIATNNSTATAFRFSHKPNGISYCLTAGHVVDGQKNVKLYFGSYEARGYVVLCDTDKDVGVVATRAAGREVKLSPDPAPPLGTQVVMVGCTLGTGSSARWGHISTPDPIGGDLVCDYSSAPGDSGGCVLDTTTGLCVGVHVAGTCGKANGHFWTPAKAWSVPAPTLRAIAAKFL